MPNGERIGVIAGRAGSAGGGAWWRRLAAAALCLAAGGCGVKGPPTLPEGVKDTVPFPRVYPKAEWPVVSGAAPAAPAADQGSGTGAGQGY